MSTTKYANKNSREYKRGFKFSVKYGRYLDVQSDYNTQYALGRWDGYKEYKLRKLLEK